MRWQPQRSQKLGRALFTAAAGVSLSFVVAVGCGGGDEDENATASAIATASAEPTRDGDGTPLAPTESPVSAGGVTLTMPAGWAFLDDGERGLVLASDDADLIVDVPRGPRLTVTLGGMELPDASTLVDAIEGVGGERAALVVVVEPPGQVPVGVGEGVALGLLEEEGGSRLIRRYVIVNAGGSRVYQFVLEAPEELWGGSIGTLEEVLGSVVFGSLAGASAN